MPARMLMKWALNVWMARSTMLRRWTFGGERLVCGFPDVIDVPSVFLACFVVEDLVVYDVTAILEVVHDSDAGWDVVAVFACLEGLD